MPARRLVVCRELTKIHETIYRGTAVEVTESLKKTSIRGEFVVVLEPIR
jgi:16S rRNA (cytidine1402-2'-O)-methyltransferase